MCAKDGVLELQDYIGCLERNYHRPRTRVEQVEQLRRAFGVVDTHGTGFMNLEDVRGFLTHHGPTFEMGAGRERAENNVVIRVTRIAGSRSS